MKNLGVCVGIFYFVFAIRECIGNQNRFRPIGATCGQNEDCDFYPEKSICHPVLKTCECNENHVPHREGETGPVSCEPIRNEIGLECVNKRQCNEGVPGPLSDCLPSTEDPDKKVCNCTVEAIHETGKHECHPIRNELGEDCEEHAQCRFHMSEHSGCYAGECQCTAGSAINNPEMDFCLPIIEELEKECQIKEQCTLGKPGLLSNCTEPWTEEPEIKPSVKYDPPQTICNCTADAITEPGTHKCYPRRDAISQICEVNAQCKVNLGELSECGNQHCVDAGMCCQCLDEAVASIANDFCLPIIDEVDLECKEPQQCQTGEPGHHSTCEESSTSPDILVCTCMGYAVHPNGKHKCYVKANITTDPCSVIEQCTANLGTLSECLGGNCKCLDDVAVPRANFTECLEVRNKIGDECSESQQCTAGTLTRYSVCIDGTCQCNDEGVAEPGEHVCRRKATHVGDACVRNEQCKANLGSLSECLAGTECRCLPEHAVASEAGDKCLAITQFIGGPCEEPLQCQSGLPGGLSTCKDKKCVCQNGAVNQPGDNICYKIAEKVDEICQVDVQCQPKLGELTKCLPAGGSKTCQCLEEVSVKNNDATKCLPIVNELRGTCEESVQCTSGALSGWSECRLSDQFPYENVCMCQRTAIVDPQNKTCYGIAQHIEDPCFINEQCTTNLGDSYCNLEGEGRCKCVEGFVGNLEGDDINSKCIPGYLAIGESCFDMAQCSGKPGESSTCSQGKCGCLEKYTESTNLDDCLEIRNSLGDSCKERQQCQQGIPGRYSDCIYQDGAATGNCRCTADASNEAGKHRCHLLAVEIGQPCDVNVQCITNLEHSQCLENRCECFDNYVASTDNKKCLPKLYLAEPCEDQNQCNHLDHAVCEVDPDAEDTEPSKICQCSLGYITHPDVTNKPNVCIKLASTIGDKCEHQDQCQKLSGANCDENGECSCDAEGEVENQNKTACLPISSQLHMPCKDTLQCKVANSICLAEECQCTSETFVEAQNIENLCLPVRSQIGDQCQEKIQCEKGINNKTECNGNVCKCVYPTELYQNYCYKRVPLGGDCSANEECSLGVNNLTICNQQSHKCSCQDPAFQIAESCWQKKELGQSCTIYEECSHSITGASWCKGNKCQCLPTHVPQGPLRCKSGQPSLTPHSVLVTLSLAFLIKA